jgi:hypothetical protein
MKVDVEGNVHCTGPGGIWILIPQVRIWARLPPVRRPLMWRGRCRLVDALFYHLAHLWPNPHEHCRYPGADRPLTFGQSSTIRCRLPAHAIRPKPQ